MNRAAKTIKLFFWQEQADAPDLGPETIVIRDFGQRERFSELVDALRADLVVREASEVFGLATGSGARAASAVVAGLAARMPTVKFVLYVRRPAVEAGEQAQHDSALIRFCIRFGLPVGPAPFERALLPKRFRALRNLRLLSSPRPAQHCNATTAEWYRTLVTSSYLAESLISNAVTERGQWLRLRAMQPAVLMQVDAHVQEQQRLQAAHVGPLPKPWNLRTANRTQQKTEQVAVLLGLRSRVMRDFTYNNIQLAGGWYVDHVARNVLFLAQEVDRHKYSEVNLVGTSKSSYGAFILGHELARCFPELKVRVFAFSPYPSLTRGLYERLGALAKLPPSLPELWERPELAPILARYGDASALLALPNIEGCLVYPQFGTHGEPEIMPGFQLSSRVKAVALPVKAHGLIYPFWKPIQEGQEVENFEGTTFRLVGNDYRRFRQIQDWRPYKIDLYNLIYDTSTCLEQLARALAGEPGSTARGLPASPA